MDELTRERFWPKPKPVPVDDDQYEVIMERRRVLLDDPEYDPGPNLRARANAMKRDRRLARVIRSQSSVPWSTT